MCSKDYIWRVLALLFLTGLSACNKDCKRKITNRNIKPEVADYFQIKKGKVSNYLHYYKGLFIDSVAFTADSPYFRTEEEIHDLESKCTSSEFTQFKYYTFRNSRDPKRIDFIKIEGNYAPNLYDGDIDHTNLQIYFNHDDFTFYDFGSAVVSGGLQNDSIICQGKNYGIGWVISYPKASSKQYRIYFNATYGIIQYENFANDEQYYLID